MHRKSNGRMYLWNLSKDVMDVFAEMKNTITRP